MFRIPLILLILSLVAFVPQRGAAQSAVNVASYANPNLPNGSLAQGGMFTVFGSSLGPAALAKVDGFPLPTTLAGTSVSVTVGGTTLDCIMIFTSAGQVAAILPSSTPTGAGTMRVTYNGTATAPFAVTVVAHSFGTFGINSAGSGPGVMTNATTVAVNTISSSAAPGEMWDIWGTGLGAAPFPDNAFPVVQDLGYNVQVVVGGQQAQVVYAGRSGCCAGVDQIRFVVPAGLSGCYVPVYLAVNGVPSNFTSMSIGSGGTCSDPGGLTPGALSDGALTVGIISFSRTSVDVNIPSIPGIPQTTTQQSETAVASYDRYDPNLAVRQSFDGAIFTQGACTVYQFTGQDAEFTDPVLPTGMDAGPSTSIAGPSGPRTMNRTQLGQYLAILSSASPFPFPQALTKQAALQTIQAALGEGVEQSSAPFFTGGTYTYSAPGGADVGAHSQAFTIGNPLNWTNKAQVNAIQRSSGQAVTWTPFSGDAMISGSSFNQLMNSEESFGAGFFCLANGSAGSFTIPAAVLQTLPPSTTFSVGGVSFEVGSLSVGTLQRHDCQASGLDVCALSYTDFVSKQVGYR